ncbi:alpha/beta fold hydrolase [Fodinicola acaciae]|uniref:alpha/beta fold hydrolase n=1 Tax=Fodinicola acaciae TaxID=2681555 RepID=UPI0013D29A29|nr:alpha/beta hydrolase [Fodinicola acaciae]
MRANGIDIHLEEAGSGPLVLLLHGFPELSFSWRHQLPALAAAGHHAVAVDLRGYGRSTAPVDVTAYAMREMVADAVAVLDGLGEPAAALVGHDWGAQIAWAAAALHPDRFPAIAALSVPFQPRTPVPPTEQLREWAGDRLNWLLYFQRPGVADAEFAADPERAMRLIMYGLSGDAGELGTRLVTELPGGARLLDSIPEPAALPAWLELEPYVREFSRTGFTGALNRYRNVDRDWHDLPAVGATTIGQPALFIGGEFDTATRYADWTAIRERVPRLADPLILAGCGHWVQQERPVEVNDHLIWFLRENAFA